MGINSLFFIYYYSLVAANISCLPGKRARSPRQLTDIAEGSNQSTAIPCATDSTFLQWALLLVDLRFSVASCEESPESSYVHRSAMMTPSSTTQQMAKTSMALLFFIITVVISVFSGTVISDFKAKQRVVINLVDSHSQQRTYKESSSKGSSKCNDDELSDILYHIQPDQWTKPSGTHIQVCTVPRFPENHNALLQLKVLRKLDEMTPREYLTYILRELSLEERESLMVDERHRRKTFQVNWPYDNTNTLSGIKMAQAGFYSVDDYDRVQCVFCRGSLHRWERDDVPMLEHARSFAFCRFVKGLSCGNREYRSNMMTGDDLRNIPTFQREQSDPHRRIRTISVDSSLLGISTIRAAHIEYAPDASRLRTFTRWPASSPISKAVLCQAGFYFTGFDDQVRCFYCSGGLREWRITDDTWEEHARWFPDCAFLLQQKGQDYVDEIHARTPANKKCVRKTEAQKKAEVVENDNKTSQESMLEICQQLDYTNEQLERAIEFHGGEFDNIKDMIEVLYRIESGAISPSDLASGASGRRTISYPCIAEEDISRALEPGMTQSIPGEFVSSEQSSRFEQACKNCERKTASYVPATRISMPCGHLTLGEQCNTDELNGASGVDYDPKCVTCHAKLTGTMRIFFA